MVSTGLAAVLAVLSLIVASVLGAGVGYLACLALRLPWNMKGAGVDALLAVVVAVISAYALSAIDAARGVLESRLMLILAIAAGSIILRHLLRLALRSPR